MTSRPVCLQLVDQYVAGATIAHEYAFALHRRLVEASADDDHTRELLKESALVALDLIPTLAQLVRGLEREWEERDLLDPAAVECTVKRMESYLAEIEPQLADLRDRQKLVVAALLDRVGSAC
jgi:hypothetical protein